jgi:hypothetical protein
MNTVTVFRDPPRISREELLIRRAISDACLKEYEKGYEHLPEITDDAEITAVQQRFDEFGEDWWNVEGGIEAGRALDRIIHQKQAEQFEVIFAPTLPPEVKQKRRALIADIEDTLTKCRQSRYWGDKDEDLLQNHYLDNVPEEMIPFTSLPNLLRVHQKVDELLEYHENIAHNP